MRALAGYVAGRIARRWSPLWGFLVAIPLALYWAHTIFDVEIPDFEYLWIIATGVAGGTAAAFRSPKARLILGRSMALVIAVYAIWCIPPIVAAARNYRNFERTVFPQIVREVDGRVIGLQ